MKISLWYEIIRQQWGGANSFLKSLAEELTRRGHSIFSHPKPFVDVILINSWMRGSRKKLSASMVQKIRRYGSTSPLHGIVDLKYFFSGRSIKRPPLVHRVDGIAALYGRNDGSDDIQFGN